MTEDCDSGGRQAYANAQGRILSIRVTIGIPTRVVSAAHATIVFLLE